MTLDAAVAKHGPDAVRAYEEGRAKSQEVRDDFEKRIADAGSTADAKSLNIQRRNVVQFVHFPEDQLGAANPRRAGSMIRDGLLGQTPASSLFCQLYRSGAKLRDHAPGRWKKMRIG